MAYTPNTAFKDASVDADTTAYEANKVEILTSGDVVLATLNIPADAWAAAAAGTAALAADLSIPVTVAGTAAKIRWFSGATAYTEGTVGLTSAAAAAASVAYTGPHDLELSRVAFESGDTVKITQADVTYA